MEQFIDGPLESCELINEKGNYYLKLVYNYENDSYKYKITFPRVPLSINKLVKIQTYDKYCTPPCCYVTSDGKLHSSNRLYEGKCYIWTSNTLGDPMKIFKVDKSSESYRTRDGKVIDMSSNPSFYITEELEDKTKKMTLEEIEKKLGYKIELVK